MIEDTMFDNDYYVVFLEKEHEKGEKSGMKIDDRRNITGMMKLGDVSRGTCFEVNGEAWIKCGVFTQNNQFIECVRLSDGDRDLVDRCTEVRTLSAKVVIE